MKKQVFYQNNPNSSNYDDTLPAGFGYWEEVDSDEEDEDIPDENMEDEE